MGFRGIVAIVIKSNTRYPSFAVKTDLLCVLSVLTTLNGRVVWINDKRSYDNGSAIRRKSHNLLIF